MKTRIYKLTVKNYRGVAWYDGAIAEAGAVISGGNSRGKTSLLKSIRGALAARDIGSDAIREGADKAEILVDLGDISVQRAITASGSSLKIRRTATGDQVAKPQQVLNELLGTSPLDPIDLFLERDAKRRRAMILAALPVHVAEADLQRWIPAAVRAGYPLALPDLAQHGFDVIADVRKQIFDLRASVNREAKGLATLAAELAERVASQPAIASGTPPVAAAEARVGETVAARLRAVTAREAATAAHERTAGTRKKIAEIELLATQYIADAAQIVVGDVEGLRLASVAAAEAHAKAQAAAQAAERKSVAAAEAHAKAQAAAQAAERKNDSRATAWREARAREDLRARLMRAHEQAKSEAAELGAALAAGAPEAPSEEEIQRLTTAHGVALGVRAEAQRAEKLEGERAALDEAHAKARAASDNAGALTAVIDTLTERAPAELVAAANGIAGLRLAEDGSVTLDGVAMEALSGAEQLRFAVEIARRANAKAQILIVDALERLDAEQYEDFLREATRGGYQLIATRVTGGDVVVEAIQPDDDAVQASEGGR